MVAISSTSLNRMISFSYFDNFILFFIYFCVISSYSCCSTLNISLETNPPFHAVQSPCGSTPCLSCRFMQMLKFKSNLVEEFWLLFCDKLQINYDSLTVQEQESIVSVFKKSRLTFELKSNDVSC